MTEPVHDPTPADLPRALLLAVMHEAARAVERINLAGAIQLHQAAQAPSETEKSRENLILTVLEPVLALWNALEPADLRSAGYHLVFALIREMVTTSAQGIAVLRQYVPAANAGSAPAPAP